MIMMMMMTISLTRSSSLLHTCCYAGAASQSPLPTTNGSESPVCNTLYLGLEDSRSRVLQPELEGHKPAGAMQIWQKKFKRKESQAICALQMVNPAFPAGGKYPFYLCYAPFTPFFFIYLPFPGSPSHWVPASLRPPGPLHSGRSYANRFWLRCHASLSSSAAKADHICVLLM